MRERWSRPRDFITDVKVDDNLASNQVVLPEPARVEADQGDAERNEGGRTRGEKCGNKANSKSMQGDKGQVLTSKSAICQRAEQTQSGGVQRVLRDANVTGSARSNRHRPVRVGLHQIAPRFQRLIEVAMPDPINIVQMHVQH